MPCVKQTKGRYVAEGRKSPPYPAQDCKNLAKVGRDGKMWISLPDKNLKYTWKSYGGKAHERAISKAAEEEDIEDLPKSEKTTSGKVGWICEGGKCRRVPKNGNGNGKKAGSAPPKGILKAPRSKSKEKKTVTWVNGKGKTNGKGNGKRNGNGKPNGNGNGKPLEKYTVVQLRQKAKAKGLRGYSNKNKADLIKMLRNGNGSAKKTPVKKSNGKKPSAKKTPVKKSNGKKKTPVKKSNGKKKTPAQARKAAGYTKKKGASGQTLYYKNGKRVAKKNVPVKYQ
jgi:hypothetical protein